MAEGSTEDGTALEVLTTVPSAAEATIVIGDLDAAGIAALPRPSAHGSALWGAPQPLDICVAEADLARAREVLDAGAISEEELLRAEQQAAGEPGSQPSREERA